MLDVVVSPSHNLIELQFSTGTEKTWLLTSMCGYRVSCELQGLQIFKNAEYFSSLKVEKSSSSLAVLSVK